MILPNHLSRRWLLCVFQIDFDEFLLLVYRYDNPDAERGDEGSAGISSFLKALRNNGGGKTRYGPDKILEKHDNTIFIYVHVGGIEGPSHVHDALKNKAMMRVVGITYDDPTANKRRTGIRNMRGSINMSKGSNASVTPGVPSTASSATPDGLHPDAAFGDARRLSGSFLGRRKSIGVNKLHSKKVQIAKAEPSFVSGPVMDEGSSCIWNTSYRLELPVPPPTTVSVR